MRMTEKIEKSITIVLVALLICSPILAIMFPIGIFRTIFGHMFLLTVLFTVFGLPILALWPDNESDWKWIKNKFKKK